VRGLEEAGDLGIGDIAGAGQLGVADDAAGDFLQLFVFGDRSGELAAGESGEPARVAFTKGLRLGCEIREVARQLGAVAAGIEVAEIPFGQRAQRRLACHRCICCRQCPNHCASPR